jgi:hypothetical protein
MLRLLLLFFCLLSTWRIATAETVTLPPNNGEAQTIDINVNVIMPQHPSSDPPRPKTEEEKQAEEEKEAKREERKKKLETEKDKALAENYRDAAKDLRKAAKTNKVIGAVDLTASAVCLADCAFAAEPGILGAGCMAVGIAAGVTSVVKTKELSNALTILPAAAQLGMIIAASAGAFAGNMAAANAAYRGLSCAQGIMYAALGAIKIKNSRDSKKKAAENDEKAAELEAKTGQDISIEQSAPSLAGAVSLDSCVDSGERGDTAALSRCLASADPKYRFLLNDKFQKSFKKVSGVNIGQFVKETSTAELAFSQQMNIALTGGRLLKPKKDLRAPLEKFEIEALNLASNRPELFTGMKVSISSSTPSTFQKSPTREFSSTESAPLMTPEFAPERTLAQVSEQEIQLDPGQDIASDTGHSIFERVTRRYKKSSDRILSVPYVSPYNKMANPEGP